ncbi:MAG: hypothetical protein HC933_19580 [Pleurocapsa sp. SU_196_0]|nr:hypothetical protein [Pleurocapsa sp. SU_196_0]
MDRLFFGSPFSTGAVRDSQINSDTTRDYGDFGNVSADSAFDGGTLGNITVDPFNQTPAGTGIRIEGSFDPGISLNFTFKPRALVGSTTNGVGNSFSVALTLSLVSSAPYGTPSDGSDNVNPVTLKLTSLATQYTVGGAPLLIKFGIYPGFKFTNYGFNNPDGRGDGFVATLDGSSILPLNLALTIAYGSKGGNDGDFVYFTGVRGTASLIPGITGGIYYGVEAPDVITPNQSGLTTNLFGLDFAGALGPISFDGEYNVSVNAGPGRVAGYARASADFGIFTIGASYRVVDNTFVGLGNDTSPFRKNQNGFGTDIALKLGFATVGFYYDQRRSQDPNFTVGAGGVDARFATDNTAARGSTDFGVNLTLRLIGFDIAPFATRENEYDGSNVAVRDRTSYGVRLTHDGSKPDALIGGLNLAFGYLQTNNGIAPGDGITTLYVYGDATISLLGFSITPKGYFSQVTTSVRPSARSQPPRRTRTMT